MFIINIYIYKYCLGRRQLVGGVPGPGVVLEGVKEVKLAFKAARNIQKWHKTGIFPHLLIKKTPQRCFFYLTSTILQRRFLRNTSILKNFIISGVMELYQFKVLEVIYAPSTRIRVKL
jgi:hypothetical protein